MTVKDHRGPALQGANLFIQTRARLQRVSDGHAFGGWVEAIDQTHVRVRLKSCESTLDLRDEVNVELAGAAHAASFRATVMYCDGSCLELALTGPVDLTPRKESAHVKMSGERCKIIAYGAEYAATTLDISEHGLGVLLPSVLDAASPVEFNVYTSMGSVHGLGEIVYCREEPSTNPQFRAGIRVKSLSAVGRARWDLLLNMGFTPR
ncbi:MAG: PilZ domain-containing protein [Fimbriimonadaceae bacterium]